MEKITLILTIALLLIITSCNKTGSLGCIQSCNDTERDYRNTCNLSINLSKRILVNEDVIQKFKEIWNLSYNPDFALRKEFGLCLKMENITSNTPIIKSAINPILNNVSCPQLKNDFGCPKGYLDGRMHTHPCSQCCGLSSQDKGIFIEARKEDPMVPFFFGVICSYNLSRIYEHEDQITGYSFQLIN